MGSHGCNFAYYQARGPKVHMVIACRRMYTYMHSNITQTRVKTKSVLKESKHSGEIVVGNTRIDKKD